MPFCCIPEIGVVRSISASHAAHPDAVAGFRFQKSPPEDREARQEKQKKNQRLYSGAASAAWAVPEGCLMPG